MHGERDRAESGAASEGGDCAAAVVPMLRVGAGGSDESAGGRGEDG